MGISRRNLMIGGAAVLGIAGLGAYLKMRPKPVVLGFEPDLDILKKAKALIAKVPSFDLHAHPGRTFVKDASGLQGLMKVYKAKGTFEDKSVASMKAGGMNAVTFCTVADFQILNLVKGKGLVAVREFEQDEAWLSYQTQMGHLKALSERGLVQAVYNSADILDAKKKGSTAALFGSEGGDYLGASIERLRDSYQDGIRVINPMHYHHNEIGDIMTAEPHHNGLTDAGSLIIKEMNGLGMVIDGAHSSLDSLSDILDISDKPIICSHTHILQDGQVMPRFITKELALRVAQSGGVIGAWPAGIGISTMDGMITRILELVDIVGIDHVGIGTDMDANYKPVWDDYADFPLIVMRMMQRGLSEADIAKIIGGNGLRVLRDVTGA